MAKLNNEIHKGKNEKPKLHGYEENGVSGSGREARGGMDGVYCLFLLLEPPS